MTTLRFPPIFDRITEVLKDAQEIYLVGGAVRDAVLHLPTHDLDFVLPKGSLQTAKQVADRMDGAFFVLDETTKTGRVILDDFGGERYVLDFAEQRGAPLEIDLRARDFTINAMALDLKDPTRVIDPLGGGVDLHSKELRACSPDCFSDDPLRTLRAVRFSIALGLKITSGTIQNLRKSVHQLTRVSPERIRDELFRILGGPKPDASMRILEKLELLPEVFPELIPLIDLAQPSPHVWDAWSHTLHTMRFLISILSVLEPQFDEEIAADLSSGMVSLRLGRFREQLGEHMNQSLQPDRTLRALLIFAALYHDVGKPDCMEEEDGQIRFLRHESAGAKLTAHRARELRLSNHEINRLTTIVQNHMRPLWLTNQTTKPSRRSIYRFFRDCGSAGVDVCLVSLADYLATYGNDLSQEGWTQHLDTIRALLEGWWEYHNDQVDPPNIIDGEILIREFTLEPGPRIGEILEAIREEQAEGAIQSLEEAIAFARTMIDNSKDESTSVE